MSGNFLTPNTVWKDFKTHGEVKAEILAVCSSDNIAVSHLRISGRKTADGEVKIYAKLVRQAQLTLAPAILLVQDFNGEDDETAKLLAEKGYAVLAVDIAGSADFNTAKSVDGVEKPFTVYPESLSYANYDAEAEYKAEIVGDARATCWYEWARVIRYAAEYLKAQSLFTKIGLVALGKAATPAWQVISANCGISCAVIAANAGWKGYRGIYKFGDTPEPQFTDDSLKYLAGIEPQAYAAHVKCPLLFLAPTNSPDFDLDRSYDTVSRVPQKLYAVADYSVGGRREINAEGFNDAIVFLDAMLVNESAVLPETVSVKGSVVGDKIQVEVSPDKAGLKNLSVYFAEEEILPELRSWEKTTDAKETENGNYIFEYTPYADSERVFFFARAEYENGMRICSVVTCKKLGDGKISGNPQRVLYSSRQSVGASGFYHATEKSDAVRFNTDKNSAVTIKNGPMDISGLYCPSGITTFKINVGKYKPLQGAILMFDVFVKGGGNFRVNAVTRYFGEKTVYTAQIKLFGDLWQNVKIEINNFKTEQGLGLKSYDNIEALEFYSDESFLINNILWV